MAIKKGMKLFLTALMAPMAVGCGHKMVRQEPAPMEEKTGLWLMEAGREAGKSLATQALKSQERVVLVGTNTKDKSIEDGIIQGLIGKKVVVLEKLNFNNWKQPNPEVFYVSMMQPENIEIYRKMGAEKVVVYRLEEAKAGSEGMTGKSSAKVAILARVFSVDTAAILFDEEIKAEFVPEK